MSLNYGTSMSYADDRRQILSVLTKYGPQIDQELEGATGLTGNSLRYRRHELLKAGQVEPFPGKRPTRAGRPAQLWQVAP